MDQRGFYPKHPCKNCGTLLQGFGDGTPAETYAGTYTGLCYRCSNIEKVVMKVSALDNAYHISYAPLNPSWRRDRTNEIGYLDCDLCKGEGRIYQGYHNWSRQFHSCIKCKGRYYGHPLRKAYCEERDRKFESLYRAATIAFAANIEQRYGEHYRIEPKAKVKGRGKNKTKYRTRSKVWTVGYLQNATDEVQLAYKNTALVYFAAYETKRMALEKRMGAKHAVAIADMQVVHSMYNKYQ